MGHYSEEYYTALYIYYSQRDICPSISYLYLSRLELSSGQPVNRMPRAVKRKKIDEGTKKIVGFLIKKLLQALWFVRLNFFFYIVI